MYICYCLCFVVCDVLLKDHINVNLRMIINRRGISDCETAINCFKNDCTGTKFSIQILEKLPGNGYRNGAVYSQMLEYRLQFDKPNTCSLTPSFRSVLLNITITMLQYNSEKLQLAAMVLRCHLLEKHDNETSFCL